VSEYVCARLRASACVCLRLSASECVLHQANHGAASTHAEKLLVLGGYNGVSKYADMELRELHIGADWAWRRVLSGALGSPGTRSYSGPSPRAHHSTTRLAGDRLLCFGGADGEGAYADVHILDLSTMAWSQPSVRGSPPSGRSGHAAVALDGVRVLVHGGWGRSSSSSVSAGATSGSSRSGSSTHALAPAQSLALAGSTPVLYNDVAIFDTETWEWTRPKLRGMPPAPRVGHSLVPLPAAGREPASLILFGGRAEGDAALNDLYELRPAGS